MIERDYDLVYISELNYNLSRISMLQIIQMCNAFHGIGFKVLLMIPFQGHSIEDNKRIFEKEFGIKLSTDLAFYQVLRSVPLINKYFSWISVGFALRKISSKMYFVRNVTFGVLLRFLKVRFIFEAHNFRLHLGSRILDSILTVLLISIAKTQYCVQFICISEALRGYWSQKGISRNKLLTLHDGYDSTKFPFNGQASTEKLDIIIPEGRLVCTYTGSLFPDRGVELILLLAVRFPELFFVVAGGPEVRKREYERIIGEQKITNIVFTGSIPHNKIPELLSRSHILLALWSWKVPTIHYCSPLKIFEYMASGKIILAEAYPTIKEVLNDKMAVLVEPENITDLTKKLEEVLNNLTTIGVGKVASAIAAEKYSWHKRVLAIIERL